MKEEVHEEVEKQQAVPAVNGGTPTAPDYGQLGADAILKYTEAAAVHVERVGQEFLADAQTRFEECKELAEAIRETGRMQAGKMQRATLRAKRAALSIGEARDEFRSDQAREPDETKHP